MDVDAPNILKRCSSAPLINEAVSTVATSPTTNVAPRNTSIFSMFSNNNLTRTRRHSGTFGPVTSPVNNVAALWSRIDSHLSLSVTTTPEKESKRRKCSKIKSVFVAQSSWARMAPRVDQLRAEECADVSNKREVAHEREIHTAMQMGQSCEDLTLVAGLANSPTRIPRFSPVVSPSPTRKYTTRRSLSPIAIRASSFSPVSRPNLLSGKRRCDEADSPLSKRMCTSDRLTPSTPGTPDSDSLECTFRPVSPRAQPMNECSHESTDVQDNHKSSNPS